MRLLAVAAILLLAAGCIQITVPDAAPASDASATGRPSTGPAHATASASHSTSKPPAPAGRPTPSPTAPPKVPAAPGDYTVPAVPAVDAAALLADLGTFAVEYGDRSGTVPTHEGARGWLSDTFARAGLTVWRHNFTANGLDQHNIIGIHWGLDRTAWVVVSAHYDTTTTLIVDHSQSQGAYDDGSGTMLVAHLAKAFADRTMPYTIAFVEFDGEERGLEGSKALVADLFTGDTPFGEVQVVGDVDIDMFGLNWPGTGAPMVLCTNSQPLQDAVQADRKARSVPDSAMLYDQGIALGTSDYSTFFAKGVPTGFLYSDFEQIGAPMGEPVSTPTGGVYPWWHQHDTMQTMTLMAGDAAHLQSGFQAAADLAVHLVHFLASTPGPIAAGKSAI